MHYMSLCLTNVLVTGPQTNAAMEKPDLVRSILLIYLNDALIFQIWSPRYQLPTTNCGRYRDDQLSSDYICKSFRRLTGQNRRRPPGFDQMRAWTKQDSSAAFEKIELVLKDREASAP